MKAFPIEQIDRLKVQLPDFVKAVDGEADFVIISLDAFEGNANLLFDSVWYATSQGKRMIFAPKGTKVNFK